MEKIPTAEEFCKKRGILEINDNTHTYTINADINDFVEFAKLHVKAALEAAAENAKAFHQYPWTHNEPYVDVHSVTSAYPDSNIQ